MNARTNAAFDAVDAYESRVQPVFPPLEDVAANEAPRDKVVLVSGATLKPVPVAWLWKHWLALKKLHILAGMPGQGKTTIAIALAATITIGGKWPDGSKSTIGNVIFWSGEDDPADTLVPRLAAAGADLSRCYFITGAQRNGEVVPFDPAQHLPMLREQLEAIGGVSLLVVDPVVSAVTGDSHKNTEVRRALQPLVDLASVCNCAILGITHFAKGGQGSDPSQRVVGSVAFTAVARIVMVAAKVKGDEGEDKRVLARSKSNIGPDDGGFEYHLEQIENADGIHASRIAWGQSVEGSARELLTDPAEDEGESPSEKSELGMLLWAELRDGPTPSKAVEAALVGMGYSKKQVRTAREKMFIKPQKNGMGAGWYWSLPDGFQPKAEWLAAVGEHEDALEDAQDAQLSKQGKLGTFGASSETDVEVI